MAKGNMFQGMARGSVGDVTFSVLRGQQIARVRNRQPSNPRTSAQVLQRAIFSDAVKFFVRGTQNLFQFAFEDKAATESDYNAFMRHNAKAGIYITQAQYNDDKFPAIGNWMMTYGSLASPRVEIDNYTPQGGTERKLVSAKFTLASDTLATPTTLGELSAMLVAGGEVQEGDIITMLEILTNASAGSASNPIVSGGIVPEWGILQFTIDSASAVVLDEVGISCSVDGDVLSLELGSEAVANWSSFISAYACIRSHKTTDGLKVSTSILTTSAGWDSAVTYGLSDTWKQLVKDAWGAKTAAILEGSESVN